jgi:hypothetical protein
MPSSFLSGLAKPQSMTSRASVIVTVIRTSPVVMVVLGLVGIMMMLGAIASVVVVIFNVGETIYHRILVERRRRNPRVQLEEHQLEFFKLIEEYKLKGTIGGYRKVVDVDVELPDDEEYFSAPEPEVYHALGREYLGPAGRDGQPSWIRVL